MADDGKRSETICAKVTERVALDVLRVAALDDRSPSEWLNLLIRRHLYGHVGRGGPAEQAPEVSKVNQHARSDD